MNVRPKRVPRLWCARLGLLPFDVVLPSERRASEVAGARRLAASGLPPGAIAGAEIQAGEAAVRVLPPITHPSR